MSIEFNQLTLTADVAEIDALRYTPSGVPAVNCKLEHASEMTEAGQVRQVKALVKSVSFGSVAERLVLQDIGSNWKFKGFLATPRGTKQLVFHIQEFAKD
ncbi:MAG: primosomal replication protein N [Rhodoferax sp.]|uniref:primosomal replication protein N n=1 Tax=Rhodoferax sp. TaxID=50421 RepID=UPI0026084418|nr:primosomal replication protein N [Rhodoferax sp.]MDD2880648.1 primosomal replication protein N [Rhodoferax sp.]